MILRGLVISTFLITCTIITVMDIQKQKIYNETVAVLFVPAIVSFFVFPEVRAWSRLLGSVSVSGIMLLMCLLIPGAFGGGDIKMMVPVGMFLGIGRTLTAGVLAVMLSGLGCVFILSWRRGGSIRALSAGKLRRTERRTEFPFGPALCTGSVMALLAGDKILMWFLR